MKKLVLPLLMFFGLAGWLFSEHWYRLPRMLLNLADPIEAHQEITWEQGPEGSGRESGLPNIVLIVADDLGFNDITFYGGGIAEGTVPTPNIDGIAAAGMHFPNGYAANATCAPSRAALLTGRFATRSGFEFTPASPLMARFIGGDGFIEENAEDYPETASLGLPGTEVTIPELLDEKGYHSIAIGKWHLGGARGLRPLDQGFDEFLGMFPGAALFMAEDDPDVINSKQDFDPIDKYLWANLAFAVRHNNGGRFEPDGHMTDYFSREAAKAIEANRNRPFFLYLAYNAPHTPLQSERGDYEALAHIEDHTERTYAGMIRGLDRGVGHVLRALEANGVADNTIVFFTSDNGGAHYVGLPDLNKPYRGWKMTFFEGGIRTPYFVKWPEKIPPNSHYDAAVSHIDVFSTILAAAGVDAPGDRVIDGVDLLAAALSEPQLEMNRPLFWRTAGYKVVRQGGWKLQLQEQNGKAWLYYLPDDPTEQINLADARPEKVRQMTAILYSVDQQMVAPLWPRIVEGAITVDHTLKAPPEGAHEVVLWSN